MIELSPTFWQHSTMLLWTFLKSPNTGPNLVTTPFLTPSYWDVSWILMVCNLPWCNKPNFDYRFAVVGWWAQALHFLLNIPKSTLHIILTSLFSLIIKSLWCWHKNWQKNGRTLLTQIQVLVHNKSYYVTKEYHNHWKNN